jgi:hypothetical protein
VRILETGIFAVAFPVTIKSMIASRHPDISPADISPSVDPVISETDDIFDAMTGIPICTARTKVSGIPSVCEGNKRHDEFVIKLST